jgi:hypothetical protein
MSAQRIGYLISGLILLVVAAIVALAFWPVGIGESTPATSADKLLEIPRAIDLGPFGPLPTGGDATTPYDAAFTALIGTKDYRDFGSIADTIQQLSEPEKDTKDAPIIKQLIDATHSALSPDTVFHSLPVDVKNDLPTESFLAAAGSLLTKAGASTAADGKLPDAETDEIAGLLMGDQLWTYGQFVMYRSAGLATMADAATNLHSLYADRMHDDAKAAAAQKIMDAVAKISGPWSEKEKIIRDYNPAPGDLANLAQHDADRSWRIEGTIWLGYARWRAAGKQRDAIVHLLQTLANSPDAAIAQAAQQGLDLTEVDFRTIRID